MDFKSIALTTRPRLLGRTLGPFYPKRFRPSPAVPLEVTFGHSPGTLSVAAGVDTTPPLYPPLVSFRVRCSFSEDIRGEGLRGQFFVPGQKKGPERK
ncbi:hypothetical protein CDAR_437441 [Caerostris darwini]|uniref:Uncharacterized protein n=1 Tax=Caerostris darwini TaxID=1538125 RepID=A0AAV4NU04_9ARAC|nr:hypothetical protein CDAR_437441 [Caerostris darwini]